MTESSEEFACQQCDESFDQRAQLNEHMETAHDVAPNEESEDAAAAGSDASGSTGSITEETNDSPGAAEPSEAAGPSESDADVRPDEDGS
ncbi:C2H2-type zinc finger protein [Haladaptatus caseinilyticus]|uniref:C2H2-type zinc finger protein n=1 Tax=Haladaptatus caseinilyticus TaxID=2993314 RepID=UPI00224ADE3F|nr:C2H2-type zinc finger protein [Haladaptatus caseinilyticus]